MTYHVTKRDETKKCGAMQGTLYLFALSQPEVFEDDPDEHGWRDPMICRELHQAPPAKVRREVRWRALAVPSHGGLCTLDRFLREDTDEAVEGEVGGGVGGESARVRERLQLRVRRHVRGVRHRAPTAGLRHSIGRPRAAHSLHR